MNKNIFNTSNEDGLLKSIGPHRNNMTSSPIFGTQKAETFEVKLTSIATEVKIYDVNKALKKNN